MQSPWLTCALSIATCLQCSSINSLLAQNQFPTATLIHKGKRMERGKKRHVLAHTGNLVVNWEAASQFPSLYTSYCGPLLTWPCGQSQSVSPLSNNVVSIEWVQAFTNLQRKWIWISDDFSTCQHRILERTEKLQPQAFWTSLPCASIFSLCSSLSTNASNTWIKQCCLGLAHGWN